MDTEAVEFDFTGRHLQDSAIKWLVIPMLVAFVLPYGSLVLAAITGSSSFTDFFQWFMKSFQLDYTAFTGEPWRFVTYMFLHGGLIHLLFNMMALFSLYLLAKTHFPRYAWLVIFFASGIIGGLAEVLVHPQVKGVVGASAGVFGLWGGALAAAWRYSRGDAEEQPWGNARNLDMLTKWLFINFVIGMAIPGIAGFAHAGGLVVGLLFGMLYPISGQPRLLATRPGLFVLAAYKKTPEPKVKAKIPEQSYFTWIRLLPTAEFDPTHDALVAEYDWFDWQGQRTVRFQVIAGATPPNGLQEMYEVATPQRIAGFTEASVDHQQQIEPLPESPQPIVPKPESNA
jgi:membrane associated rhomboid family serine protease